MRKAFLIVLLIFSTSLPQDKKPGDSLNLFSPPNIKKFADYLFCQGDYLRAAGEYENYLKTNYNDTVEFKIAVSLCSMDKYSEAAGRFADIPPASALYQLSKLEFLKTYFLKGSLTEYRAKYSAAGIKSGFRYSNEAESLYNFSYLLNDGPLPDKNKFLASYMGSDRDSAIKFYNWKEDPPHKSALAAALMSAVIPGLGKFYTHEYWDGVFAFLSTGILGYLSYSDFKADHNFRGWLFAGLAAGFYGGNIYGSAASAQLFNAKVNFDFTNMLKNFLSLRNYFIPNINFCR